jgi:hypothetical protein
VLDVWMEAGGGVWMDALGTRGRRAVRRDVGTGSGDAGVRRCGGFEYLI